MTESQKSRMTDRNKPQPLREMGVHRPPTNHNRGEAKHPRCFFLLGTSEHGRSYNYVMQELLKCSESVACESRGSGRIDEGNELCSWFEI